MFNNVCFTINNYGDDDLNDILALREFCHYVIIGFEVGEQGTPHIQGYCELLKKTRTTTFSKILKRSHNEPRRGTQSQAINYCKKENDFVEHGVPKCQGQRNDLDMIRRTALDGGMREVTAIGNLQQIHVAEKFLTYNEPVRDFKPEIIWIYGPSGAGKSRRARELCVEDTYCKNTGTKWWNGYDAHKNIIIDDFRDDWWPITYTLGLLDRYEFQVEFKGGLRQILAEKIVITSIAHPEMMYRSTGEDIHQLLRRIDHIIHIVPDVPEVDGVIIMPIEI